MTKRGRVNPANFKGVSLVGGPLDGWVVGRDAPALAPEWWRSWPCWQGWNYPAEDQREPGRYVLDPSAPLATAAWQPLPDEQPPPIRRGLLGTLRRVLRGAS